MEDQSRHHSRDSNRRRLETPSHSRHDGASRSRSRLRNRDQSRSRPRMNSTTRDHRDQDVGLRRERVKMLERELLQERQHLLAAEECHRSPRRRRSEHQEASHGHRSACNSTPPRDSQQRGGSGRPGHSVNRGDAGATKRSRSPSVSKNILFDILKSLKDKLPSQTHSEVARSSQKIDSMNILPNFDPSTRNQRIDVWLKKVNECALVYGWDDRTTTHFAMQKLQGLAKIWYEGLNSVLFSWCEWQEKLINAFPCEQNYGQALEDMLKRRSKINEPIEVYFYEKLTLVSQCDIVGKRAVDCIIHGINDRNLKSGALALRCTHPDQLLQFLISSKDCYQVVDRNTFRNRNDNNLNDNRQRQMSSNRSGQTFGCYNCKERGHSFLHCPKPLIKCTQCNRVGHTVDKCFSKLENKVSEVSNAVPKTMCVDTVNVDKKFNQGSKFIKEVNINGKLLEAFVDFGSEVTLIGESSAQHLGLVHNNFCSLIKGFGNGVVQSLGEIVMDISVDGVIATVVCKVVSDSLLERPLLIGQTYTEQPHIIVYKDKNKLQFIDLGIEMPRPDLELRDETMFQIKAVDTIVLYGVASVRCQVDPPFNGDLILKGVVAGKPNNQYFVCGGFYTSSKGHIYLTVLPCSESCRILKQVIMCRAESVDVVNKVIVEPPETSAAAEFSLDLTQVSVGSSVSQNVRRQLYSLLHKYRHCFASSLRELGCTNVTEMNIELSSQRPIVYRPYRLSHHERDKVRAMVKEMLDAGIVRESVSEYSSPVLLVRKKDGSHRMCVDYRMLNSITIKERYPMPIIEDEIARLSGKSCFITLDLASGYYQVPISERCKHLTSFVTPDGQFEFNRMPFGLANAPAVFQRMMNSILGPARYSNTTAYIDDILIFGKDEVECLEQLETVLQVLAGAHLRLNLSKCHFLRDKIDYLGYEISSSGVKPGERKIQSVTSFPRPVNVHNVRQFLGLASYFRKFVRNFAEIAFPLSKLLKKDAAWEWNENQEKAFEDLKSRLVDRPVLAIYDASAETELHTDASRVGVGGILLQRATNGDSFQPVAYYSRQTSPEEKNFHSYELETLAVVCSLRKFRVYLLGKQFKIVTDCSALRSTFSKRDLIPRIARWWLLLQEFDCSVEYRAGMKMSHVDALSRNSISVLDETSLDQFPSVMSISSEDWLHTLQLGDTELRRICSILDSNLDEKGLKYIRDNYTIKNNKLYRYIDGDKNNIRWVVPKGARWQICRMNHDDIGHFGLEKTLERIKSNYWFSKMKRFVKKYVQSCIECAYAKNNSSTSREGLLHPIEKLAIPFHTLHIDHLGPFVKSNRGYTHLLVIVDSFTKFCCLRPIRNTNSQNTIRALDDIFYTFKTPTRLITDRGSCFTSHSFKKFCEEKNIKHILNAVASPRSNGQVERYNRTILDSLRALTVKFGEKEWDTNLGQVQWGLNNTVQRTIGKSPSEVLFGTRMNSEKNPILSEIVEETRQDCDVSSMRSEVKTRIDSEQEKQKLAYDKNRKPARIYREGDLVKITKTAFSNDGQSKKLLPTFIGPFRVIEVLGNDRYRIAPVPGLKGTYNKRPTTVAADRMMPWIHIAALQLNDHKSDVSTDDDGDT